MKELAIKSIKLNRDRIDTLSRLSSKWPVKVDGKSRNEDGWRVWRIDALTGRAKVLCLGNLGPLVELQIGGTLTLGNTVQWWRHFMSKERPWLRRM